MNPSTEIWYGSINIVTPSSKKSVEILDIFEFSTLKKTYRLLYPNWNDVMTMSESYEKYTDIVVLKDSYSSHKSLNSRSAFFTDYCVASGGQIIEYRDIGLTARLGTAALIFLEQISWSPFARPLT